MTTGGMTPNTVHSTQLELIKETEIAAEHLWKHYFTLLKHRQEPSCISLVLKANTVLGYPTMTTRDNVLRSPC